MLERILIFMRKGYGEALAKFKERSLLTNKNHKKIEAVSFRS
jgi:hypothetical protein